ncbi:MAG: DNA polymerase III subunit alpha [Phycisphaerae bacterium]|nr:DNA polymerase III subunit alpha [Phycisphaerae bacterium]
MTDTHVPFVHLHTHTHYSLLDGGSKIGDLIAKAKALGMDSLAITDHGNMFGAIEFYKEAKSAGIKPIIGYEAYIAPGDRRDKEAKGIDDASFHLLLLAMDLTGYRNLLKLASTAYLDGFYYRPRIDKQVLREHHEGLICASACLAGEIPQAILREDVDRARQVVEEYLAIFGPDRFFLELQDHDLPEQKVANEAIIDIAKAKGVGLIATNDIHYTDQDDARAHEILVCVNTGKKLTDEKRLSFGSDKFYMRSGDEMAALFPKHPQAIANTVEIASRCNLDLNLKERHAPVYQPPTKQTPEDYLRELVYKGAAERYGELTDQVRQRIDYELEVICSKGFGSYFLIVWDFVNWCHEQNIPCGARGSAGGCVVGYCLGIIAEDPLEYDLLFERFMDPERDEMPDIDIDICQDNRGRVIEYVRNKYGHVAQIITFNTMAAKAAIRDVGRVLDIPLADVDAIAKLVPIGPKVTLAGALESEPEFRKKYDGDETVRHLIDIAKRLEGLARNVSVHAAGVVVADRPLDEFVPLAKSGDDVLTQFEGTVVEKVGLLKMDFLGLRTLTTLQRAVDLTESQLGKKIDLDRLPLDDQTVLDLFGRGETKGIFQFESDGMRDLLMRLKPDRLANLIAANALYRPGPMTMIDDYIQRKHGAEWNVPHPKMREILEETFGIMVYQEQVMKILNGLGNLPLRRSYNLIKAISKKLDSVIASEYENFLAGCDQNGVPKKTAEELFELIRRFGGYGFNKSHSTRYAVVAYQTAYMKAYFPLQFMAALLTFEMGDTDKVVEYIQEAKRMGIEVLPPDVNASGPDFTVVYEGEKGVIRFGLAAVKGVGAKAVEAIVEARQKEGKFQSIFDFCCRVDTRLVNRGVVEALIKCGAFDSTGDKRKAMFDALEEALRAADSAHRDAAMGQMSFFETLAEQGDATETAQKLPNDEWDEKDLLAFEKATLGFYVTSHPLSQHAPMIERFATTNTEKVRELGEGTEVILGGLIEKIRKVTVKSRGGENGEARQMGIIGLEDLHGRIEVVVFPDDFDQLRDELVPDKMIFVRGTVDKRREDPSIRAEQVYPLEKGPELLTAMVTIKLSAAGLQADTIDRLHEVCKAHRGQSGLAFVIRTADGNLATVRAGEHVRVAPGMEFLSRIDALLGPGHVILQPGRPNGNGNGNGKNRFNRFRRNGNGAANGARNSQPSTTG